MSFVLIKIKHAILQTTQQTNLGELNGEVELCVICISVNRDAML